MLEAELNKQDLSLSSLYTTSEPNFDLGFPVIEVSFSRCVAQPISRKSKSKNGSVADDTVITVPAPVLIETKTCGTLTSFEIKVDVLERTATCSLEHLNRQNLITLISNQLANHKSAAIQINRMLKEKNANMSENIPSPPLIAVPYHFPLNLWKPSPPLNSVNPSSIPSEQKETSEQNKPFLSIATEFLPFLPSGQTTCSINSKDRDSFLLQWRQMLHEKYDKLTENEQRPTFRPQNAISFKSLFTTQLVFDESSVPELNLSSEGATGSSMPPGRVRRETVQGRYAYFHYSQDGMNDSGWGCAYRSLQTVWSWFLIQAYTHKPVLTHRAIQETLHKIGDKPVSFVGSNNWIGSFEVSYVLDHHLDVVCAFINVQSGDQLVNHLDKIAEHFATQGTPIMVGGGVLAHTICGIAFDQNCPESSVRYLILDPHYIGPEDLKTMKKKNGFSWKPQSFWKSNAYYNLCLPRRPKVI